MTEATAQRVRLPRLYEKQGRALFSPARYSVIEASTKAGKTFGALIWQATQCLRDTMARDHWWVAPVYPQSEIAYRRAKRYFKDLTTANDSKMLLIFTSTGARWTFKSGEKPDNLYGEDVASCVIDEFTRVREEAWYAIRSTLTFTRGPIRFIGNVKGRGNWGYRLARKAEAGEPDHEHHVITARDAIEAGVLHESEIQDAERALPPAVFRELYFCEPSDDGGNPFGLRAIGECTVADLSISETVCYGVDLAKSHDWTAVVGLDCSGQVTVLERWQSDWQATTSRLVRMIGNVPALVDETGVGAPIVERLQQRCELVEGFTFTGPSKQELMGNLAMSIQQRQVLFPAGWLVNELETFEYEYTRTGVKYSAPEGYNLHDDGVCALALAVRHLAGGAHNRVDARVIGLHVDGGYDDDDDDPRWTRWSD